MLVYLKRAHDRTIEPFVETWAPRFSSSVRVLFYEQLGRLRSLPRNTVVFSDLERLTPDTLLQACRLAEQLQAASPPVRILNDPRQALLRYDLLTLLRYDLLTLLHERGINDFHAYRLGEPRLPERYPVFLRLENSHDGPIGDILYDAAQLERAIARCLLRGLPLDRLLVVEYCETADSNGIYRKYSAFVVGDEIIPRMLAFGPHWVLKYAALIDEDKIAEERRYVQASPQDELLREVARLACVDNAGSITLSSATAFRSGS